MVKTNAMRLLEAAKIPFRTSEFNYDEADLTELGKAWLAGETLGDIAREWGITIQMVRTRLKRLSISSVGRDPEDDSTDAS